MGKEEEKPTKKLQVQEQAFPTEARLRQKEKLKKDKELGIAPKKKQKHVIIW